MKILVIGAEGQVGGFLLRELVSQHDVWGTSMAGVNNLPVLDIRDAGAVSRFIEPLRPDHVILTAAMTHVDKCEELPQEAEAINIRGAEHVARACKQSGAGMTYFSSDYIFDGQSGPYGETDTPHPLSVYGRTKWEGEQAVAGILDRYLIIRTMVVYSFLPGSVNLFMQLLLRAFKGEPITAPSDQIINPTQAVNLTRALSELIITGQNGVFNLAGTTRINRDEFCRQALKKLGFDPGLVKTTTTAAMRQKAPRPLSSGLKTEKAQAALNINKLWDLDTALDYTLTQMPVAEEKHVRKA